MNKTPLIIGIILLFIVISVIIYQIRKRIIIQKIRDMSESEKSELINNIAAPFGYFYDCCQDVFSTRLDAAQKIFGYTSFYDRSAPYFNMIFDYEPVYFDYDDKTWLIEMWKGQYGLTSGCEVGIYSADKILEPSEYKSTVFKAVDADDMPYLSTVLRRYIKGRSEPEYVAGLSARHWWLTLFKPGIFTKPENLSADISISFPNRLMMNSFIDSFRSSMPGVTVMVSNLTVSFTFRKHNRRYNIWRRFVRWSGLNFCRFYTRIYNHATRSFTLNRDRILYIYYFLPFILRRIFR